jgi:prepilin-type processing-associated H-X9-DG protein
MTEPTGSRPSPAALVTFVLGVSSLVLSLLTALPALYLGLRTVQAINSSDGRLGGRRLAIAGMAVAGFSVLATVLGFAALVLLNLQDKSYQVGCANNLRAVGVAVNAYGDLHEGHFPAATIPNPTLMPEQRLSWQAAILPVLPRGMRGGHKWDKLAAEIAFEDAWDAPANAGPRQTNVASFLCPTFTRGFSDGRPGLTTYVGISGIGVDAATLSKDDPRAGIFGYERTLTRQDISAGISFTLMAVETAHDNGPWLAGGNPTTRGLDPDCEQYFGLGRPLGGLHRDGANVLWADGSARFLKADIAAADFRALARIHREADQ